MGHYRGTLSSDALVGHFKPAKRPLRTRLPPELTRQSSTTRASCETSSKTHASSFESAKRAFRTRLPPKVQPFARRKSSGNLHRTHTSSSPAKQFRDSSPSKQRPLTRESQYVTANSPPPQLATSRFSAPATKLSASTRLTQPHDSQRLPRKSHFHTIPQNPHKVLHLPRKVTISYHVSCNKPCATPHNDIWNDCDTF